MHRTHSYPTECAELKRAHMFSPYLALASSFALSGVSFPQGFPCEAENYPNSLLIPVLAADGQITIQKSLRKISGHP